MRAEDRNQGSRTRGVTSSPQLLRIPSRTVLRHSPLRTPRLVMPPVEADDGPDLWEAIDGCRRYLEPWLPWVPFNDSPEASQRYAEACVADWDAGRAVRFAIRDPASWTLLGVVGLDSCVHLHRSCELGYWLRQSASGRGFMTEAARACVEFAFRRMGVHRVRCAAATDNHPSLRVIARLGFRFEGIARQAEFVADRWLDHAVFGRLATDD
jgi:ribosomal-protein-serine acetyltransferase